MLVERLLAREGEIHVLVRPGSEEKLEARVERLGAAGRIHAVPGDLAEPYLGVDQATRDALRGKVDHFFHLAAIYDMTADETAERAAQRRRHAERRRPGQRAAGGHLPPRVLDRGRRHLRGPLHRGHVRRGAEPPVAVPPHEVRVREARALARARARGASTGRRSWSATRAPARWTRSTAPTTSSRRSRRRATRCPSGSRCRAGGRLDQHRAGRLGRRRDGPHRARAGLRRAGVPPRQPAPAARRRRAQHVRPRRPRAADGHPDRQADDRHAPEGRAVVRDEAAGAQGHPPHAARRHRDPRHRARAHGARPALRRARHPARAQGHRHRGPAAGDATPRSSGTTGSATSIPTCSRTARSPARSTARPS